jgi:hypothetical protein
MDSPMQVAQGAASAQVIAGDGRIFVSAVLNPGSTASTLTIYDNTAGSGTIIAQLVAPASGYSVITPDVNIPCRLGIYAVVAGTGATWVVYFA